MTYRLSALSMETSCGVVLVNYGTVLLLQYPQGHWDFPKGHVEETDEDHFSTARRELNEETGISEIEFIP
ncbi:MAG: NUDIX domain-containing protein, partial [Candidatus Poseidoniaceae archaeon]|nr:NUDIX domain-containing protein [Candidatus Poseidoniaceae archaeon]